jgi:hypothetical protein
MVVAIFFLDPFELIAAAGEISLQIYKIFKQPLIPQIPK